MLFSHLIHVFVRILAVLALQLMDLFHGWKLQRHATIFALQILLEQMHKRHVLLLSHLIIHRRIYRTIGAQVCG